MLFQDRILSLYSAVWIPWMMLCLIVLLFLLTSVHPQGLGYGFRSFVSLLERRYVATGNMFSFVCIVVFCVLSTALACCIMLYRGGEFRFVDIMTVSAIIVACMLVKRLLTAFAGYVFSFEREAHTWQEQNIYMWFALSMVMTAVSAVAVSLPVQNYVAAIYMSLAILYILAVIVKFFRVFASQSPFSALYIIMYILTLEVLPLAVMVKGAEVLTA